MKSDRELLELAAKAAGYDVTWLKDSQFIHDSDDWWDPLTYDGDALRLAVKLHMQVSITTESCRAETLPVLGVMVSGKDELAATRMAIVMAAANASADKL